MSNLDRLDRLKRAPQPCVTQARYQTKWSSLVVARRRAALRSPQWPRLLASSVPLFSLLSCMCAAHLAALPLLQAPARSRANEVQSGGASTQSCAAHCTQPPVLAVLLHVCCHLAALSLSCKHQASSSSRVESLNIIGCGRQGNFALFRPLCPIAPIYHPSASERTS